MRNIKSSDKLLVPADINPQITRLCVLQQSSTEKYSEDIQKDAI